MRTFREKRFKSLSEFSATPRSMEMRVDDVLISDQRQQLVRAGLDKLSIEHRLVLELVF